MDSISIKIKSQTAPTKVNPRNTYRLYVEVSHGDADFSEVKTLDFVNSIELINRLQLLVSYFNLSTRQHTDDETLIQEFKSMERQLNIGSLEDIWMDMVGFDKTTDGQRFAIPEKTWISYFDYNGIKLDVQLNINGTISDNFS